MIADYPIWEPCVANSVLIAVVSILHVFVSHFAIGGGLYLVVAETWARRKNDLDHLAYLERFSRFFALITLVFGAVTGVGIWVTIGLIHPTGAKWLVNNFVWGWAIDWVFFFVEIAAALIYYYGWKRLPASTHLALGWIYFIAALMSLFVINGILTFMLTPGEWLITGSFWDGFFNPTFWPSLVFRTVVALALAGLYAVFTVAGEKKADVKIRILRGNGLLILTALALAVPCGWWYFHAVPETIRSAILPGSIPATALQIMLFCAALLFALTLLGTVLFPRHAGYVSGAILLLCALLSVGGFEWAREALRKPYIIHGFIYSNGLLAADAQKAPFIQPRTISFSTGSRGRDLFLANCRSCHTISGYSSLADRLAGWDKEYIENSLPRLKYFIGPMPPFAGNKADAALLATYLISLADPDPLSVDSSLSEPDRAQIVFHRRCGVCHTMGGFRAIGAAFQGLDTGDAKATIKSLPDLTEAMPPFTGSKEELGLLIPYLTGGGQ